jgi:gamma-glutamyltranspeptidase/glutathione hydrolase
LLTLVRTLDLGQELSVAVAAPRHHHQWRPDTVLLESSFPQHIAEGLKGYGHRIEMVDESGITQAIGRDAEGRLVGVHDPRIPGKVGYGKRSDRQ